MSGVLKGALAKRISGEKPSSVQAVAAAVIAGAATAVLTYRVMRS
jgi:hypothetical protein